MRSKEQMLLNGVFGAKQTFCFMMFHGLLRVVSGVLGWLLVGFLMFCWGRCSSCW